MARGFIIGITTIIIIILGVAIFNLTGEEKVKIEESGEMIEKSVNPPVSDEESFEEIIFENNMDAEKLDENNMEGADTHRIDISTSGFHPEVLEINEGDRVIFFNKDGEEHWPATDVHPTHRAYPGSDIGKCKSEDYREKIFDACHGLTRGERYEFVFNERGSWRYHDHLRPSLNGVIVVN